MARITAADITALGFTGAMFNTARDDDFAAFVDGVIAEQSALLEGEVGASVYGATDGALAARVKRAETCLVAAELVDRRINIRLADVQAAGEDFDVTAEERKRDKYRSEADKIITLTGAGEYAGTVVETPHFGEGAAQA